MTRYRRIKGRKKAVPLRGGLSTVRSEDRGDWTKSADRTLGSDKTVLPKKGSLFGSEKLGDPSSGTAIVTNRKATKGESGFGI